MGENRETGFGRWLGGVPLFLTLQGLLAPWRIWDICLWVSPEKCTPSLNSTYRLECGHLWTLSSEPNTGNQIRGMSQILSIPTSEQRCFGSGSQKQLRRHFAELQTLIYKGMVKHSRNSQQIVGNNGIEAWVNLTWKQIGGLPIKERQKTL